MELSLEKRKPKGSPLDYGEDYDYNQLWSEKYEPKLSKDLVLHHSKIKATRDCLLRFCSQKSETNPPNILILCGCSGCGKSTLIKILCEELSIDLVELSEDIEQNSYLTNRIHMPVDSYLEPERRFLDDDTDEFALRSSYPSLIFDQSVGKSSDHSIGGKESHKRIILIHTPSSLNMDCDSSGIAKYLASFRDPVILIISDVVGKDDCYHEIDELIPKHIQQCFLIETIYFPPITERNVFKVLSKIAGEESRLLRRAAKSRSKRKRENTTNLSEDELREISITCLGDLRHAISALQIRMLSNVHQPPSLQQVDNSCKIDIDSKGRDKSFSMLHGIGKLLHSTLKTPTERISFDPEFILQNSDLPLDISLSFLQWNSYEIFASSQQSDPLLRLEKSCQYFSDCQILLDRQYTTDEFFDRTSSQSSMNTFPNEYVISLAARIPSVSSLIQNQNFSPEKVDLIENEDSNIQNRRTRSGLIFVRRPRNLDLRSASVLFRNRLLNIRNYTSQQTGNMHTTSEMITTNLPYFRYFVAVPRHIQFPTTLKNYILSIDPRNRSSLNLTTADDDPYDLSEKIAGRSSQSQITNIENRINFPSTSGIDIEDIDSFSD